MAFRQVQPGSVVVIRGSDWNKMLEFFHGLSGQEEQLSIGVKGDGERVIEFANEQQLTLHRNGVFETYLIPMRRTP